MAHKDYPHTNVIIVKLIPNERTGGFDKVVSVQVEDKNVEKEVREIASNIISAI